MSSWREARRGARGRSSATLTPNMQPRCPDSFRRLDGSWARLPRTSTPWLAIRDGKRLWRVPGAFCVGALPFVWSDVAAVQDIRQSRTIGGTTVYLGVVPAKIEKGLEPAGHGQGPMHGRASKVRLRIILSPPFVSASGVGWRMRQSGIRFPVSRCSV